MMKRMAAIAAAAALVMAASAPAALAQDKKAGAGKRKPSQNFVLTRERQKKCGTEWKEAKAAGKTAKGEKWPQFWSACNKRLKAAGA